MAAQYIKKDKDTDYLLDLHKSVNTFLNKALLVIPGVSVPFLLNFVITTKHSFSAYLAVSSSFFFATTILILLYSFFITGDAIENLLKGEISKSQKSNKLNKKLNKLSFYLILIGVLLGLSSVTVEKYNSAFIKNTSIADDGEIRNQEPLDPSASKITNTQ